MSMEYIDSSFCPFCEWYNALKSRDKYYEDGRDGRSCVTEFKYGAALVHESVFQGQGHHVDRQHVFWLHDL